MGLKQGIDTLFVLCCRQFQKDPCGVEAWRDQWSRRRDCLFQKDPCGVEAVAGNCEKSGETGFQKDPCGVEASVVGLFSEALLSVSEGPLWG